MKFHDFITMNRGFAIVITVGEYYSIKDKLREFYTDKDFEHIDDYCKYKWTDHKFLLCNPNAYDAGKRSYIHRQNII